MARTKRAPKKGPKMTAPVTAPTQLADADIIAQNPALVSGRLYAEKGKIMLHLDCSGLHALLRTLGVKQDTNYDHLEGCPSGNEVIDTATHKITSRLLCRTGSGPNPAMNTYDIGEHYNTPPTLAQMRAIAASVEAAREMVLRHYQPVEILIAPAKKAAVTAPADAPAATSATSATKADK